MKTKTPKKVEVKKIRVSDSSMTKIRIERARRGGSMVEAADRLISAGYRYQMSNSK